MPVSDDLHCPETERGANGVQESESLWHTASCFSSRCIYAQSPLSHVARGNHGLPIYMQGNDLQALRDIVPSIIG